MWQLRGHQSRKAEMCRELSKPSTTPVPALMGVFHMWGPCTGRDALPYGGPCTMGTLGMFTPNNAVILQRKRPKRSTRSFESDCQDNTEFGNPSEIIAAPVFALGVASAQASLR